MRSPCGAPLSARRSRPGGMQELNESLSAAPRDEASRSARREVGPDPRGGGVK